MKPMMIASDKVQHVFELSQGHAGPFKCVGYEEKTFQACPGEPVRAGGSCDHCGTGIRHTYIIKAADGYTFRVGSDCVAKTGDAGLISEIKQLAAKRRELAKAARREARLEEARARARTAAQAFLDSRPELAQAFAECAHTIVVDIKAKLDRFGSISTAQIALVLRLWSEQVTGDFNPADPPPVNVPAFTGRATVTAKVLGTKLQESMYGDVLKMLLAVRTPEGVWKAWSTVPSGLKVEDKGRGSYRENVRGMVVTLKATVEVSDRDPGFAFFKRPCLVAR